MFVRVTAITEIGDIERGAALLEEQLVPALARLRAYRGLTLSGIPSAGTVCADEFWETEEALASSASTSAEVIRGVAVTVGGSVLISSYEQVISEVPRPDPTAGCPVLVRRITGEPADLDGLIGYIRDQIPAIKAASELWSFRVMVNREAREGIIEGIWPDAAAMGAVREALESEHLQQVSSRGTESTGLSIGQLLLVHAP